MRVHAAAIGSDAGAAIPDHGALLRDESGAVVATVRDAARLGRLASATGGELFVADAWILLPSAALVCRTAGGEMARVATPEATLEVSPLPETGRPAGFRGLVGPFSLRQSVSAREVRLGESVRVELVLQGDTNLWDAREPEGLVWAGAEVFAQPSGVELERGPRLLVRRRFALELVPRETGELVIPAVAFPYFDPQSGRYGEAASEAVRVRVGPARPRPAAAAQRRPPRLAPPPRALLRRPVAAGRS